MLQELKEREEKTFENSQLQ